MRAIGLRACALAVMALALACAAAARAAELVVPSAAAVRAGLASLPERFAAASGHQMRFVFGTAGGTRDKVTSGEPFDLAIAPPAVIADLAKGGFLVAGKGGPLGTTRLGVAVKQGGARPVMATADDFKAALAAAPSIGLADPATGATTGVYFAKLLADLGVADALKAKIKIYPDGNGAMEALAKGEVAIAAGQISEILPVAGVELVAPLPEAIQLRTTYSVGLSAKSANPEAAALLLAAMFAPETTAALKASGFDIPPRDGDYIAKNFKFNSGEVLPELKLHYTTLGTLKRDAAGHATNAVLMLHGTTGTGRNFLAPSLAGALFGPGQPLDIEKYYIILPDGIGRGGSSKPSDGLRTKFPHYGYNDMVAAQHAVVTEALGIDHLNLIVGTSMGGMQSWLWAEHYPDMADGIMPVASQPVAATGRNYMWRLMIVDAIRSDPDWKGGDYATPPAHFVKMLPLFNIMTGSPRTLEALGKTQADTRATMDKLVGDYAKAIDANDYLYWFTAIDDYNPEPEVGKIKAKVFAVNFADDLLNPAQLGRMEQVMPKVAGGGFVIVPEGPDTIGHQTLTLGKVWAPYLAKLIASLPQ